jgi:hypothetical protein
MVARSSTRPSSAVPCPSTPTRSPAPAVDPALRLDDEAFGVAWDEEERDTRLVARLARGARGDHERIRTGAVEDVHLAAAERPALPPALGARRDVMMGVATARLLVGDGEPPLACDHRRQDRLALRRAAAEEDRRRAEEHRSHHGLGHEPAPQLLEHHHQVGPAEPRTPVLLRHHDSEPAELRHRGPQRRREAGSARLVAQRADPLQRRLPLHELPRRALEDLLLLGECQGHSLSPGGRGRSWR